MVFFPVGSALKAEGLDSGGSALKLEIFNYLFLITKNSLAKRLRAQLSGTLSCGFQYTTLPALYRPLATPIET
jgi:hypothetical protein